MKNRNLWRMIFTLSAMVTLIGLGFTAYNLLYSINLL